MGIPAKLKRVEYFLSLRSGRPTPDLSWLAGEFSD